MTLDLTLDPREARVLGVLVEKDLTTPEPYPLTLNSLTAGCNQKSNREPVLELMESDVYAAVQSLIRKGLGGRRELKLGSALCGLIPLEDRGEDLVFEVPEPVRPPPDLK